MRHVYIGSAWPYVNGPLHLGHVAALVPADFLARYHRLRGDRVLWTSGSDCHGTPITVRAQVEGRTAREVAEEYHALAQETFRRLGFSYSLYWATMNPEHHERVQASFKELYDRGFIIEQNYRFARCEKCGENRADREIVGKCPICNMPDAKGDQCSVCGCTLNPSELLEPSCGTCHGSIGFRSSRELFFDLTQFEERLRAWVGTQSHWRENARLWTEGWLKSGLKPRAITREIDWGIHVPIPGWEHRRIYVWFEAVHGYLTASMQWAEDSGNPDAWKPFWLDEDGAEQLAYYAIGKDNIPFHSLLWPAILMGRGGYVLPRHIVSSEYLNLKGSTFSTSKNRAIWAPDFLDRYDPDFLRYFLTINGPEKRDTDFTWSGFVTRVNRELINGYGNLVQRVLCFLEKHFEGRPASLSGAADQEDEQLLDLEEATFRDVGNLIEATEFHRAIEHIMELVQATNQYLSRKTPWKKIADDREGAHRTLTIALNVIASLCVLTEPFMPFQAQRLATMLGGLPERRWEPPRLDPDVTIGPVAPLFTRLENKVIEEEVARLKAESDSAP